MYAYVLVNLTDKSEKRLLSELQDANEVKEAHILFGEWDLIVKLEVETPEQAGDFVMEQIRSHPDVRLTSTLIVAK